MITTNGQGMSVVLEDAEPVDWSVNDANMEQAAPHKPYGNLTSEQAIRWGNANGLLTIFPAENQLQLDIDSDAALITYYRVKPVFQQRFQIVEESITPSRSGLPKRHITLTLDKSVSPLERILFQACLGSDPMRELLSYRALMEGEYQPTLFFEVPANE